MTEQEKIEATIELCNYDAEQLKAYVEDHWNDVWMTEEMKQEFYRRIACIRGFF